ncbi:hypothetical protein, partial [Burkholderia vietnamiensis]|uniref:hypothetical protein n=1 Tax=Burkholderia vietnamiensis TaxID=60552 RepID=UPI00352E9FFB
MRTKLTVKNPRPASPTRAPVRSGSLVARKAVRPAAPAPGDKPPRAPSPLESRNGLKNLTGTIAMARTSDPNS